MDETFFIILGLTNDGIRTTGAAECAPGWNYTIQAGRRGLFGVFR